MGPFPDFFDKQITIITSWKVKEREMTAHLIIKRAGVPASISSAWANKLRRTETSLSEQ